MERGLSPELSPVRCNLLSPLALAPPCVLPRCTGLAPLPEEGAQLCADEEEQLAEPQAVLPEGKAPPPSAELAYDYLTHADSVGNGGGASDGKPGAERAAGGSEASQPPRRGQGEQPSRLLEEDSIAEGEELRGAGGRRYPSLLAVEGQSPLVAGALASSSGGGGGTGSMADSMPGPAGAEAGTTPRQQRAEQAERAVQRTQPGQPQGSAGQGLAPATLLSAPSQPQQRQQQQQPGGPPAPPLGRLRHDGSLVEAWEAWAMDPAPTLSSDLPHLPPASLLVGQQTLTQDQLAWLVHLSQAAALPGEPALRPPAALQQRPAPQHAHGQRLGPTQGQQQEQGQQQGGQAAAEVRVDIEGPESGQPRAAGPPG